MIACIGSQSSHWRVTCRYDTDGVVYTDYTRASLADCNILTLLAQYGTCFKFELINIRGHECVACTTLIWIEPEFGNSLHTDSDTPICEFNE